MIRIGIILNSSGEFNRCTIARLSLGQDDEGNTKVKKTELNLQTQPNQAEHGSPSVFSETSSASNINLKRKLGEVGAGMGYTVRIV